MKMIIFTKDVIKLVNIEERLDISLNAIGTMHDDEQRAREQLEEMKIILILFLLN